jgi:hypothetical protein
VDEIHLWVSRGNGNLFASEKVLVLVVVLGRVECLSYWLRSSFLVLDRRPPPLAAASRSSDTSLRLQLTGDKMDRVYGSIGGWINAGERRKGRDAKAIQLSRSSRNIRGRLMSGNERWIDGRVGQNKG